MNPPRAVAEARAVPAARIDADCKRLARRGRRLMLRADIVQRTARKARRQLRLQRSADAWEDRKWAAILACDAAADLADGGALQRAVQRAMRRPYP